MASNVRTYTITLGKVYNGDVECTNPTITIGGKSDVLINCVDQSCGIYTVQVGPNDTEPCITFIVECEECGTCPPQTIVKCFCDSQEDCDDCEICSTDGFCEPLCDPENCVEGVCHECLTDNDCDCNQICDGNGNCSCAAGLTLNPLTGCCDECSTNEDCEDCEICEQQNGVKFCVPKDCPGGVPSVVDCGCVECNNSGDCEGVNECCDENNECNCCDGFIRIDGVCTWVECQTDDQCDACEICDENNECSPLPCGGDDVCNPLTNGCEPPCENPAFGFGNLNGFCVECDTLSCEGEVSECSQADGCGCDENGNCVAVDCSLKECISWEINDPVIIPGTTIPGTGVPAPSFTITFTELGLVPMSSGDGLFLDYNITIVETGGNVGSWSAEGSSMGSSSTVCFRLSDVVTPGCYNPANIQWNNVGFEITYTGLLGQTGSIVISNSNWFDPDPAGPNSSFFVNLLTTPANWVVDVQGEPVLPDTSGGSYTPGSYELCPCGENTTIVGTTWTTIEGNLTVNFTPLSNGCRRATIQGCGTGEGTVTTSCAGILTTMPIPELPFDFSGSNCCDPITDENCDGTPNDGFGCTTLTVVQGDIVLSNTGYTTADGFGLFRGVFQPDSIGYSVAQWIRIARTVCWNVTGTVREATTFIPPVLAHLFHDVEYRTGDGCLRLGYNCDIKIANCQKVQAEACFNGCPNFTVQISGEGPTYTAIPSIGSPVQLTFAWTTNTDLTSSSSTITVPDPNTTVTTLSVTVTLNVNGVTCIATATKTLVLDSVLGCKNVNACNFDENATEDDGSCVFVGDPTYTCGLGFQPGLVSQAVPSGDSVTSPSITYRIEATEVTYGSSINPGSYTVDVYFNGVLKCSKDLIVPQCYQCDDDVCIPSPLNSNSGIYSTADCGGACDCDIFINITPTCNNNQTFFTITPEGDTGVYKVTVNKVAGPQVLSPGPTFLSPPFVTPLLCDGVYNIIVEGENCTNSVNYEATCFDCANSTIDIENPSFDTSTNVMSFDLVAGECTSQYTVQVDYNGTPVVGLFQVYPSAGVGKTLPFGTFPPSGVTPPGDGVYTLRLIDTVNGCVRSVDISLDENGEETENVIDSCSLSYTPTGVGNTLTFSTSFTLSEGGGFYTITLKNTSGPGNCVGAIPTTTISTITNQPGVLGVNVVNFIGIIVAPAVPTCYAVEITKNDDPSSTCTAFVSFAPPTGPSMLCSGEVTFVGYDELTGEVVASWAFVNTSNDLTIEINAYPGAVCGVGLPVTVTSSGNGAGGSMVHIGEIPQLQGVDQCVEVIIYDTNDPTCTHTLEGEIPGCECDVEILGSPTVDPEDESITILYRTKCTSGQVDFFITGDGDDETASDLAASVDGEWVEGEVTIPIGNYPSTGGTVNVEMTDNADGACTITLNNIVLPENCVGCGQVASFYLEDTVVTQVRDEGNNLIASGTYDLVTDENVLEADIESGLIAQGANFCLTGPKVDVESPREAGAFITQDSTDFVTLDHALITHDDWVGTRKTYFGDCGCETGRVCDYTADLPIGALDDTITFYYGTTSSGLGYTGSIQWTGMTQTPSGSFLTAMENDILTALTTLSGCEFTVDSVSVTYDTGTDILTVVISGTNAAIGVIIATDNPPVGGLGISSVLEFTQSGCV